MSSFAGYKRLDSSDYTAIPSHGVPPGSQGAYPAGPSYMHGGYQAQGAPPPGWNPGGVPQQGGAQPPPFYPSTANSPYDPGLADESDDDQQVGSIPSAPAPPVNTVDGYECVGYTAGDFLTPPTSFTSSVPSAPPEERPEFLSDPTWTDEEVREALLEYVSQFCCYGSGTAKNLVITDKIRTGAYHYILETFGESRQVNWAFKPYKSGDFIDGPENGRPPGPWEMPAQVYTYFEDVTQKVEVPHTSYVRPCHICSASGNVSCRKCFGRGQVRCKWCHGRGIRSNEPNTIRHCTWCNGHGRTCCRTCDGNGCVECPSCESYCNLRHHIELTIQWKNHVDNFISQETSLPTHLIKDVPGRIAFQEAHMKVWPINNFVIPQINTASNDMVTRHGMFFSTERILQQRHTIRIVPIVEVKYSWKNTKSNFFVYGLEKKVFSDNYPQTCCCGCTIL